MEDYFKILELTEDDLTLTEDAFNTVETYSNPEEYYNVMSSRYTHCMIFEITHMIYTQTAKWTVEIPHIYRKLFYLFDVYGIEYSQPVVVKTVVTVLLRNKFNNCKFIDFYGYKAITHYNTLTDFSNTPTTKHKLNMVLFFNLPKANSYIAACNFTGKIIKCLFKNGEYSRFLNRFSLYNLNRLSDKNYIGLHIYNSDVCSAFYKIDKASIEQPDYTVVKIINLFFPENNYSDIKKELKKDTELLLRLYRYFPD